jgi:hypothetical protein
LVSRIEESRHDAGQREGADHASTNAGERNSHPSADNHVEDFSTLGAKRPANTYLTTSLCDPVGQESVHADHSKRQRGRREGAEQKQVQPARRDRLCERLL